MSGTLPQLPEGFEYRLDLAPTATPRLLKRRPVHRWFYFPHSYSPELVEAIVDKWGLRPGCSILDPFVGAGTTLLVSKERGYNATGLDISPLAILVTDAKIADYDPAAIQTALLSILEEAQSDGECTGGSSSRYNRALTVAERTVFGGLRQAIEQTGEPVRGFLLVGLLSILPKFSRAVADGGWFRWVEKSEAADSILPDFQVRVQQMLEEVERHSVPGQHSAPHIRLHTIQGDARMIHPAQSYDALITSPPYPNRHDYSRVFHIELLTLGYDESSIFQIRYGSLRSHVEARSPCNVPINGYSVPTILESCVNRLPDTVDARIPRLLNGYAEDMYHVLRSVAHCMKRGSKVALVVGNVRYAGVLVPVDEILAEVGQMAGFSWTGAWVIRLRGNSAQQMGLHSRLPARESVVFFEFESADIPA